MTVAIKTDFNEIVEIENVAKKLMCSKHYSKLGQDGIFAIITKAKSMNVDIFEALNGGMYFVQGKVEMQGQLMLSLIRQAGHSVTIDPKSTNSHVIMWGKRADNGDKWCVDFSIDDAKRAGIYRGQWEKYPKTMCIWRCVSMLSRFLFPDVIKGCYVAGEIADSIPFEASVIDAKEDFSLKSPSDGLTDEMIKELEESLARCDEFFRLQFKKYINDKMNISDYKEMPLDLYQKLMNNIKIRLENERKETAYPIEENSVAETA